MEKRLMYLDRLKVFMTVLVVLHHTAIVYGGSGSWPYYEHQDSTLANVLLTMFTAVNQSFFMGLFFFISGYVTPASYDRQGGGNFLKARLFRYGIPLLFYMLAIVPLLRYAVSGYIGSLGAFLREELFLHPLRGVIEFEVGPLWYLEALLLFFAWYAVFRQVTAGKPCSKPIALTGRLIAGYVIVVAAANVLVRLVYPVGTEVLNLQLAYFPAYIGLFMGGVAAYRGQWLQMLTKEAGRRWAGAAILLIVCMAAGMALGGAVEGDVSAFIGGLNWQAAFYATIDPLMGLGISYVLLVWFRERWNGTATKCTGWLTANAFFVYIVHALSVTYVAIAFRSLSWHPILKFVVVGCIAVILSYTAATIIRRIPGVKKVI
ncbi:acyltransferase family protein [Paenibacillus allorhizosphaerae]|uniref:Glucans biosynthesis protein C n=1 Tax=Paenibacillus allorhizosphaerae TaxID=2849866 RepID=A0ABM8VA05_9BACL|nr:acyltransferase family protein [Paenibacillus allorhizosphaerae]CAG7614868.1 Glucans biosynthesis protein C [Paenibacillus allorhizosphaerae]